MATAAISYDVSDFAGVDFDPARTKVYATNNAEDGVIHDVLGNKQYIGSGNGVASDNPKRSVGADGTGTITVPIPGAGFIPASWQTTIHFDGPDRNDPRRGRKTVSFGPYTITASGTLGSLIEEQAIPATYINQVTAQLDAKVTEAETAATSAAASAAQAKSVAEIDASDALVTTLVNDPASTTKAALSATFVPQNRLSITPSTSGGQNTKANPSVNLMGAGIGTANIIAGGGTTAGAAAATPNLPPGSPFVNAILGTMTAGVSVISGGYDNVIDVTGAGANTIAGGAHHRIVGNPTDHGTIVGGSYNTITSAQYAFCAGGTGNTISASYAAILGGDGHTASGTNATVAGGKQNTASGSQAFVTGLTSTASGASAFAAGRSAIASGAQSAAIGYGNTASATASLATGQDSKAASAGQWAHSGGKFAVQGDNQASLIVVRRETTDATTGSTTPNITPQDGATTAYRALVVARDTATGDSKAWTINGLIRRSGNTVTQVGGAPTPTVVAADTAAGTWNVTTLNGTGSFVFRVTGEAGKTIHWTVRFDTAEVI